MSKLEGVDFQAPAQRSSSPKTGEENDPAVRREAARAAEAAAETSRAHRSGEACRQTTESFSVPAQLSHSGMASLLSQVQTEPPVSEASPKPALGSLPKPVIPHKAKTPVRGTSFQPGNLPAPPYPALVLPEAEKAGS